MYGVCRVNLVSVSHHPRTGRKECTLSNTSQQSSSSVRQEQNAPRMSVQASTPADLEEKNLCRPHWIPASVHTPVCGPSRPITSQPEGRKVVFESVRCYKLNDEQSSPRKCHMVRYYEHLRGRTLTWHERTSFTTRSRWPAVRCTDDTDRAIVTVDSLTGTLTMVAVDERDRQTKNPNSGYNSAAFTRSNSNSNYLPYVARRVFVSWQQTAA
jgi:hypothetical protein